MATELAIALDFSTPKQAESFIDSIGQSRSLKPVFKVGLELFLMAGPVWVENLVKQGHRVFLDLKFYDIPNTVSSAALQAQRMGVDYFTVHLSGGSSMIQKTKQALNDVHQKDPSKKVPKILGVSVLTSFDEAQWQEVTSAVTSSSVLTQIEKSVLSLVSLGKQSGVDGIVCSPLEVARIKKQFPEILTVVPGIRLEGDQKGDQARVMTPKNAALAGADLIVVGRPITQAKDPNSVINKIIEDIQRGH